MREERQMQRNKNNLNKRDNCITLAIKIQKSSGPDVWSISKDLKQPSLSLYATTIN